MADGNVASGNSGDIGRHGKKSIIEEEEEEGEEENREQDDVHVQVYERNELIEEEEDRVQQSNNDDERSVSIQRTKKDCPTSSRTNENNDRDEILTHTPRIKRKSQYQGDIPEQNITAQGSSERSTT